MSGLFLSYDLLPSSHRHIVMRHDVSPKLAQVIPNEKCSDHSDNEDHKMSYPVALSLMITLAHNTTAVACTAVTRSTNMIVCCFDWFHDNSIALHKKNNLHTMYRLYQGWNIRNTRHWNIICSQYAIHSIEHSTTRTMSSIGTRHFMKIK